MHICVLLSELSFAAASMQALGFGRQVKYRSVLSFLFYLKHGILYSCVDKANNNLGPLAHAERERRNLI